MTEHDERDRRPRAGAAHAPGDADIELYDVHKAFGAVAAVRGISLAVRRGEFFSLLGPSGCGKSTTLRILAGFEEPDQGRVIIAGRDMVGVPAFRRPTNLVFQRLALFPHMSVFENVAFGLRMKGTPRAEIARRVRDALMLVQLDPMTDRKPHQLSGGQQQRVALVRALVNDPRVLLLDEPLGALDLKLRVQMQQELKRIQVHVGTTFVYVTHDQSEALTMSDRIAIMHEGRVLQVDSPRDLYNHPRTQFVALFVGDTNLLHGRVRDTARGGVTVDVGPILVHAQPTEEIAAGAVHLSVRHERVRIAPSLPPDLPNRFPGRVREVVFSGASVRYTVAVSGGALDLFALQAYDGGPVPFGAGDDVVVGWEVEAATLLRA
ncbi:MAG TPA: ABC transporter ATP-binding protein [bacterium]|nr:ABC transporter ATP-binding protein [bacterium]